jgi:hypothetical protein
VQAVLSLLSCSGLVSISSHPFASTVELTWLASVGHITSSETSTSHLGSFRFPYEPSIRSAMGLCSKSNGITSVTSGQLLGMLKHEEGSNFVVIVPSLDNSLVFGPYLPAAATVQWVQALGFWVNCTKSIHWLTWALVGELTGHTDTAILTWYVAGFHVEWRRFMPGANQSDLPLEVESTYWWSLLSPLIDSSSSSTSFHGADLKWKCNRAVCVHDVLIWVRTLLCPVVQQGV